jgi:hypothetical protein
MNVHLFPHTDIAPMQVGAPVWGPDKYSALEHRGSLDTVDQLSKLRKKIWALGKRQMKQTEAELENVAHSDDTMFEMGGQYKGVGENSVAKFEMIKLMLDEFFITYGEFEVLHVSFSATWRYDDPKPYSIPFKWTTGDLWTNGERFMEMKTGFMFINEEHLINIRLKDNHILMCETQMRDSLGFSAFLKYFKVFPPGLTISTDKNTPQQVRGKGGCNTMAMVNALLRNTEYASVQDGNELKIPMVEKIIKKLMKTGTTPSELAGSDWKHWKLGINAPWESYREVLSSTGSDGVLVEYASAEDPNRDHHLIKQQHDMHEADSDADHPPDSPLDDSDTESEGLMEEKSEAYHDEGDWLGDQLDRDAIDSVPKKEWVKDHREARVAYEAGGWSFVPFKRSNRDEEDEDDEDEDDEDWVSGDAITEEEHMQYRHRHRPSKYTDFHRKYDWN